MNRESSCCSSTPDTPVAESCCGSENKKRATENSTKATSCCGSGDSVDSQGSAGGCCDDNKGVDWLLWVCLLFVLLTYCGYWASAAGGGHADVAHHDWVPEWAMIMMHTSVEMVHAMWWGILSAAFFVGLLGRIPRELVMSVLGKGGSIGGLFRATLAGLMLDLCNHGILLVAMKLYERGASLGQVMAFLIASPWNSLTLTLILVGLVGLSWTLIFIVASLVIALLSGWVFEQLVAKGTLPGNPHQASYEEVPVMPTLRKVWGQHDWSVPAMLSMFWGGLKESKSVLRWVLLGIVLVAAIRAFVPEESFSVWFGASMSGLLLTLLATTVIEVCSEGSSPIAADLVNRAAAPGNAFAFLMAGAATDYTEIMALKETTKSWKIALYLPLVTVPQVLVIGYCMNQF